MVPIGDEYAADRHPDAERGVVRPVHDVYAFMCLPFMVPWLGQAEDGEALTSCTTVSFLQIAAVARRAREILGAGNCLIDDRSDPRQICRGWSSRHRAWCRPVHDVHAFMCLPS
jgi:hypothetical protein